MGVRVDPITEELVERCRAWYRMFRENDPAFLDTVDLEVEWHVPDTFPGGGALHGHWEVLAFLDASSKLWEAYPEPEEFLPSGNTLVVLGAWRGQLRTTLVRVDVPFAHVLQFRAGKLVYFRNYLDAAKILLAMEAAPPG